jgi:hypothetical protein
LRAVARLAAAAQGQLCGGGGGGGGFDASSGVGCAVRSCVADGKQNLQILTLPSGSAGVQGGCAAHAPPPPLLLPPPPPPSMC